MKAVSLVDNHVVGNSWDSGRKERCWPKAKATMSTNIFKTVLCPSGFP